MFLQKERTCFFGFYLLFPIGRAFYKYLFTKLKPAGGTNPKLYYDYKKTGTVTINSFLDRALRTEAEEREEKPGDDHKNGHDL